MTEFEEYLRGTFEINNGIENDVDTLVRIHAPELLELAKKELMKDAMECHIDYYDGPILNFTQKQLDDALEKNGAKVGDKVKVIIIKE